jgi:aquaporin Z
MSSWRAALHEHWPEYLIEGWALGCFMVSVGTAATFLFSPSSPASSLPGAARTLLLALGMGMTAVLLIESPWGKRSGAHMNPAVTLAFLRLGKIHPWDALFFITAQTAGGLLGVILVTLVAKDSFARPPVNYAVTVVGSQGAGVAFAAEAIISFVLMLTILEFSSRARLARFTSVAVGVLLALFISIELPLSGTSMNPARSLASAFPGRMWRDFWLYASAPPLGMLMAAQLHLFTRDSGAVACAKLLHPNNIRCIHCGRGDGASNDGRPVRR